MKRKDIIHGIAVYYGGKKPRKVRTPLWAKRLMAIQEGGRFKVPTTSVPYIQTIGNTMGIKVVSRRIRMGTYSMMERT